MRKLLAGLREFFHPKAWVPEFPIIRKRDPDAQGYQSLWDAIRGFPEKGGRR